MGVHSSWGAELNKGPWFLPNALWTPLRGLPINLLGPITCRPPPPQLGHMCPQHSKDPSPVASTPAEGTYNLYRIMHEHIQIASRLCWIGGRHIPLNTSWRCPRKINGGSQQSNGLCGIERRHMISYTPRVLGIYTKEMKQGSQRCMNSHVHGSIVQKSQDMKTTQVPKTDEQILKL